MLDLTTSSPLALAHYPLIDRFAIECDGRRLAFLSYTLERRRTMTIDVVTVPAADALSLNDRLLAAAIAWARDNGYTVLAFCPAARDYLRRTKDIKIAA